MKIGTARFDAGAHGGQFVPLEKNDGFAIIKGHKYSVPDGYKGDFFDFEENKKKKEK
jgi:hypothetical protein